MWEIRAQKFDDQSKTLEAAITEIHEKGEVIMMKQHQLKRWIKILVHKKVATQKDEDSQLGTWGAKLLLFWYKTFWILFIVLGK